MKRLIVLRGLPGCGKTTFAREVLGAVEQENWFEADMFFEHSGVYNFDPKMLPAAHGWCRLKVETAMMDGLPLIVVSNTFTQEWEMKDYFEMAKKHGYEVSSLVVENRHGNKSVHDVPEASMKKMEQRFQLKLR